jgi:hypothetical protein
MRPTALVLPLLIAAAAASAQDKPAASAAPAKPAPSDFEKLTDGAKFLDGLLKLHHKDDHLYAEIPASMFDKPMIWPVAVSRGIGVGGLIGGMTRNFDDDWVMVFRKVGDKIHLIRKNVRFRAKAGTPTAAAVEKAYTDSVVAGMKILATSPRGAAVVDLAEVFFNDLAGVGQEIRGYFPDRNLTTFHKVKAFPENLEIEVAAVFRNNAGFALNTVADGRSLTVHLHYGISMLPTDGYKPRNADDRVGFFLTAVKDFTRDAGDTSFVRLINRWRLEKADPSAKVSVPKKPIRFWIERTVPLEYRRYVREGILEWNKAFEKIGFLDAVEVRQQDDKDEFDPEDIRFNTVRWITADAGFAIGPSRVNPYTGEILDADILFDASMVRFEREEYQILISDPAKLLGYADAPADGVQAGEEIRRCRCGMAHGLKRELTLGLAALEARGLWKPGEPVPLEFVGAAIKHIVMHEVGHTLGLRHNFKASSIRSLAEINDPKNKDAPTVGSVMDYVPVNVSPKGKPQGAFFPLTIGPYDEWAIAFGYSEDDKDATAAAAKAPTKDFAYATDEDTYRIDSDAAANTWDLGDDPLAFGAQRLDLLKELLDGLPDRVTAAGEGWQPTRRAMGMLLQSQAMSAAFAAKLVGGHLLHRDHKGDAGARPPIVPVPVERQRAALKYLRERVFSGKDFVFPPEVVTKLAPTRWYHWGSNPMAGDLTFPLHTQVLFIQRAALNQILSTANLRRLQEAELQVAPDADLVTMAEVFRTVTDGVWTDDLAAPTDRPCSDRKPLLPAFRRSLQREHVEMLGRLAMPGSGAPADARSLARMQLRKVLALVEGLPAKLNDAGRRNKEIDDVSAAHLADVQERIKKLLNASVVTAG